MRKKQTLITLIFTTTALLTFNVSAEVYTWTNKEGLVNFSDKIVENENISIVKLQENNNIAKSLSNHTQWQQDYRKAKEEKAQQAQKNALNQQKKNNYCKHLKSKETIYAQGNRVYIMSPEGERQYQSEEQRASQEKTLARLIKSHCS